MSRIQRVGINNIIQVKDTKVDNKKEIHKAFKNKLMEIEQEHIREQLKVLYDKMKYKLINYKIDYL